MSTAYARKNPDFLYPIRYGGRREILVAPFDQVIRSENEAILVYMLEHLKTYREIYPALERLIGVNSKDLFMIAISFKQLELLSFLRGNTEHIDEDIEILKEIQSNYSIETASRLRLDIALPHLLMNHDIEKLYIVDSNWNEQKMRVIYDLFKHLCNQKLFAVDGDLRSFIQDTLEQVTTMFTTDIEDIYFLTTEKREKIKDYYFLCSSSLLSNYEALHIENGEHQNYKYHDWFEKCREEKLCIVDFFAPMIFR